MSWPATRLSDPVVKVSLHDRATRAFLTLIVALFLLTPFQHLHRRADSPSGESIGTFTASSAACSVCVFRSNLALPGSVISLQEPHGESQAHQPATPSFGFVEAQASSSRAPPSAR